MKWYQKLISLTATLCNDLEIYAGLHCTCTYSHHVFIPAISLMSCDHNFTSQEKTVYSEAKHADITSNENVPTTTKTGQKHEKFVVDGENGFPVRICASSVFVVILTLVMFEL